MKTFITCAKWEPHYADVVEWIITSGRDKHGDDIEFYTGPELQHVHVAEAFRKLGYTVTFYMFMPIERNPKGMVLKLLGMGNVNMVGHSGGYGEIIENMLDNADNVFVLSKGTQLHRSAARRDIPMWVHGA